MPVALAAMEGHFESGPRAGLVLIRQPNEPLAPVHARLSSSPPEKSRHGDGESDSTIVTLGVARARQVRVAPAASSRGPFDLRGV